MKPLEVGWDRRRACGALVASGLFMASWTQRASAAGYPARAVSLIVPQPAGGTGDFVSRAVAQALGTRWRKPVVVENKPGAGGTLGATLAARAAPDGHTLVMASPAFTTFASLYPQLAFNPTPHLTPVGMLGALPINILARKGAPYTTVAEFVAYCRSHPGRTTYASAGQGSLSHLMAAWFVSAASLDTVHIPYAGSAPALTALLGGQVDVAFDPAAGTELVRSGQLHPLATTSSERLHSLPSVPTLAELGFDVKGSVWLGVMTAAATPVEVVHQLNADLDSVLSTAEIRRQFALRDVEPYRLGVEQFRELLETETATWRRVIHDAGIKPV